MLFYHQSDGTWNLTLASPLISIPTFCFESVRTVILIGRESQPRISVQENASKLYIQSAPKLLYFYKV